MKKKEENYYDTPTNFEPTIGTKKYWRKTRKAEREYGKIWLPGLFNTADYDLDKKMFWMIVVLELVGLYFLGTSVNWNSLIFYGFSIAIFMDFVCVLWAHSYSGTLNENKNRQIIAKFEKDVDEYDRLWWKNVRISFLTKYPAEVLIFLIAVGKIYFYIDAKGGVDTIIDPISGRYDLKIIGVCFIYILIFLLHVMYTGFAIHGYLFKRRISNEFNSYSAAEHSHVVNNLPKGSRFSENQTNEYREALVSVELLSLHNISQLKEIAKNDRTHYFIKNTNNSYSLYTWSVLKDDDLHALSQMGQDTDGQKLFLGIQGLKHQLNLMVSDPKFILPVVPQRQSVEN